jgi:ATP synthase protein I
MDDDLIAETSRQEAAFARQVDIKATRKLSAQRKGPRGIWFGLGMSGLVGWSVAVPTLAGAILGIWWDRRHPGAHSWTLMLMAGGLFAGCGNAWHWITQEDDAMHDEPEDADE